MIMVWTGDMPGFGSKLRQSINMHLFFVRQVAGLSHFSLQYFFFFFFLSLIPSLIYVFQEILFIFWMVMYTFMYTCTHMLHFIYLLIHVFIFSNLLSFLLHTIIQKKNNKNMAVFQASVFKFTWNSASEFACCKIHPCVLGLLQRSVLSVDSTGKMSGG